MKSFKVPKNLTACQIIPEQLIAPWQLTDPRVNFASVHGLTPVIEHTENKIIAQSGLFENEVGPGLRFFSCVCVRLFQSTKRREALASW